MINHRQFIVSGAVKGKARPRFRNYGKFVSTYTTKEDVNYENWVKQCYLEQYREEKPLEGSLRCNIYISMSIPKSTSKKKMLEMFNRDIRPSKKPDCDNIAKSICDALNKIAYNDDSQIVELLVVKTYGEIEQAKIVIESLEKEID